jgi:hypothetical protein
VARAADDETEIYSVGKYTDTNADPDPLPVKLRTFPAVAPVTADMRTKSSARFNLTDANMKGFTPIPNASGFRFSPVAETESGKTVLVYPEEVLMSDLPEGAGAFYFDDGNDSLSMSASLEKTNTKLLPNTLYYLTAYFLVFADELFLEPEEPVLECESAPAEFSTLPNIKSGNIVRAENGNACTVTAAFEALPDKEYVPIGTVRIYYAEGENEIGVTEIIPGGTHPPATPEALATNAGGSRVTDAASASYFDLPAGAFDTGGIIGTYSIDESVAPGITDARYFVIEITNVRFDTDICKISLSKPPDTGADAGGGALPFLLMLCGILLLCLSFSMWCNLAGRRAA